MKSQLLKLTHEHIEYVLSSFKENASKVRNKKAINPTDPEAGMLNRPGKPGGPHYLSHQSADPAYGIIVDVAVTGGSTNDSAPYLERIEYMRKHIGLDINTVGADSAYGTSLICQALEDMGIQCLSGLSGRPERVRGMFLV